MTTLEELLVSAGIVTGVYAFACWLLVRKEGR